MLSQGTMGAFALAILWVNTLLIAAAALKDLKALRERRAQLAPIRGPGVGLLRGRVVRGAGEGGAVAAHRVDQIGRAGDGNPRVIVFTDRSAGGEVFGGAVALAEGGEVEIDPARDAEVWIDREELTRAAETPSDQAFVAAYDAARKARGAPRTVTARLGVDREVYLFGRFSARGGGLLLSPAREGGILIAAFDPRRWLDAKSRLVALFVAGEIAVAAGCSLLALTEPHFGLVSKIGGALCLAFFLLVQPAGTWVRAAVRTPARALLRGTWEERRASSEQPEASAR